MKANALSEYLREQALNTQRSTSNIEHRTSNIQRPTSKWAIPASDQRFATEGGRRRAEDGRCAIQTKGLHDIGRKNTLWSMTADALREAIRSGRPFKVTMADGGTVAIPHSEFAMLSGSGRIFYVAAPNSDLFEALDVLLITSVEQEGELLAR